MRSFTTRIAIHVNLYDNIGRAEECSLVAILSMSFLLAIEVNT